MSPWTEWGVCNAVCGYGLKNRTAKVVQLASVGGRPCPGPSVQYALCNYPCENFVWVASAWSACLLIEETTSLTCGRGRKTRTIRLVVVRGRRLDRKKGHLLFFKGAWRKRRTAAWKWMCLAITVIPRRDRRIAWIVKSTVRWTASTTSGRRGRRVIR